MNKSDITFCVLGNPNIILSDKSGKSLDKSISEFAVVMCDSGSLFFQVVVKRGLSSLLTSLDVSAHLMFHVEDMVDLIAVASEHTLFRRIRVSTLATSLSIDCVVIASADSFSAPRVQFHYLFLVHHLVPSLQYGTPDSPPARQRIACSSFPSVLEGPSSFRTQATPSTMTGFEVLAPHRGMG